jgi:thiol-disulfide isomerase/thioredoxin
MNGKLAALLLVAGLASASGPSDPAVLALSALSGEQQTLEQYRGRIVVLNFWATWCVPCREEMPRLADVQNRYASRGVVVVGASADDESTRARIEPFVKKLRLKFPIWTGATTVHMEQLGLGAALPATAIIDREGQIAFRIIGVVKRKDLTRRIDYLLAGEQGKAPPSLMDTLSVAATGEEGHDHGEEEEHTHGGVGVEGASMVPS